MTEANQTSIIPVQLRVGHRAAAPTRLAVLFSVALFWHCADAGAQLVSRNIGVTLNAFNEDSFALDVNQDGTTDLTFQTAYVPDPFLTVGFDQIELPRGSPNGVVIDKQTGDGFPSASVLSTGSTVSSSSLFTSPIDLANLYSYDTFDGPSGNFGGQTGFVGFQFQEADGIHFGYVQISVNSLDDPLNPFDLTIGTVTYNLTAGQSAAVPEPSYLAALFPIAFLWIRYWRPRQSVVYARC